MSTNAKEDFNQGDSVGIALLKGFRDEERKTAAKPKL